MANSGEQVNTCGNLNSHLQQAHNEAALPNLKSSSKAQKVKLCNLRNPVSKAIYLSAPLEPLPCPYAPTAEKVADSPRTRPATPAPTEPTGRLTPRRRIPPAPDTTRWATSRHPLTRNRRQIGTRRGRKPGSAGTTRVTPPEGGGGGGRH